MSRPTTYESANFDVASFKDPTQQLTTFAHEPATGDLTDLTSPLGNKTSSAADPFGRVASITPPQGNAAGASGNWTTVYGRDLMGRVTKVTTPRGIVAQYTYDKFGRTATEKDALAHVTTYTYETPATSRASSRPTARHGHSPMTPAATSRLPRTAAATSRRMATTPRTG